MTVNTQRNTVVVEQSDGSARIRKFIQILAHISSCQRQACAIQCAKMRSVIKHFTVCGKCSICRQFFSAVYFHAKSCQVRDCKMHFCTTTKRRIARMLESEEE